MSWFANAYLGGTGPKFNKVEKDLNTLIKDLVVKHLTPILGKNAVVREHEYELWGNMKSHLKAGREGGGNRLKLVIKDYFDGVEKVLKANKEVMGNIIYGYTKSKRMTDNAWDEQIVNNIKVKMIHTWETSQGSFPPSWVQKQIKNIARWPIKVWDATIDLEAYTREVVKKEIGR